jgi:hypothetical protein
MTTKEQLADFYCKKYEGGFNEANARVSFIAGYEAREGLETRAEAAQQARYREKFMLLEAEVKQLLDLTKCNDLLELAELIKELNENN